MDVADQAVVDFNQKTLLGHVGRVAERSEIGLAVRAMKDMEQRLINRFMVGLGAEAKLDGAAANREPEARRGCFHRDDHLQDALPGPGDETVDRATRTAPLTHDCPPKVYSKAKADRPPQTRAE